MKRPRPASKAASSEQTRLALIRAGLRLFGEKGFAAASTRELAAAAGTNIGSIAYHFGGKEGLRTACAEFIVGIIQSVAERALGAPGEDAGARLDAVVERMAGFLLAEPQAGEIVQFILRELAHPTAALDAIYDGVFGPTHRRLCALWAEASGEDAESERTMITVFTLVGQLVYFRIGRAAVMRRLGWTAIGEREAAAVIDVLKGNLAAILASRKGLRP